MKNFLKALFYKDDPFPEMNVVFINFKDQIVTAEFPNVVGVYYGRVWVRLSFDDGSTVAYKSDSITCIGTDRKKVE